MGFKKDGKAEISLEPQEERGWVEVPRINGVIGPLAEKFPDLHQAGPEEDSIPGYP
jgi:hypothetical protein